MSGDDPAGVLHAGPGSAIGGLTALERRGLKHWPRDEITVLLRKSHNLQPLDGVAFVETRRPVGLYATGAPPTWRVEPAALLYAGYTTSTRTALGLLSAVVQQRLTTPARLLVEIDRMRPLRRAKRFKATLGFIADGSHSLGEQRVVRMCLDHRLPSGKVVVLEVDGGFHMDVEHWEDDITRERDLVATGAVVLRCTTRELVDVPERVAATLRAVGVGESSA